jgi:hypothetical protein
MKRRTVMFCLIICLIAAGFMGGIWYGANRTNTSLKGIAPSFSIPGEANAQIGCETCVETTATLESSCSSWCANRYRGQAQSEQSSACSIGCWYYAKITGEKCAGKKISQ